VVTGCVAGTRGAGYWPARSKALLGCSLVGWPIKRFFQYLKTILNLKFNYTTFPTFKNVQTLHEATFEHCEQLYRLSQLQIPNGFHVTKFGTKSNLNLPWILSRCQTCGKNLVNSLKFYLDLIFIDVNLVGHTGMEEYEVSIQVSKWLDLEIRKEFEFEFEIQSKPNLDFIQGLKLQSEVLLKHCSCYSDTTVSKKKINYRCKLTSPV
jgi:hypothetical protein